MLYINNNNTSYIIHAINNNYFINNPKTYIFCDIVYKNFMHISQNKSLNHNINEITRLVNSNNFVGYLAKLDKKIIAYLLGEIISLNDGRKVFYINYLYVSQYFRNSGIASDILKKAINFSKNSKLNAVMLTCDTYNNKLHNFYLKRGFMLDMVLRRYERHDVFSLPIGYF